VSDVELACPDIGNFKDVAVIDVLVKAGDVIEIDTPLVTLETDKATMDVPATAAGTVTKVLVERGGKVSQGVPLVRIAASAAATAPAGATAAAVLARDRDDSGACGAR
jgi:pyruvate/2-oxoglutarate dehydrogenase complex dihydrolipoamide acyltransferase (E2) component